MVVWFCEMIPMNCLWNVNGRHKHDQEDHHHHNHQHPESRSSSNCACVIANLHVISLVEYSLLRCFCYQLNNNDRRRRLLDLFHEVQYIWYRLLRYYALSSWYSGGRWCDGTRIAMQRSSSHSWATLFHARNYKLNPCVISNLIYSTHTAHMMLMTMIMICSAGGERPDDLPTKRSIMLLLRRPCCVGPGWAGLLYPLRPKLAFLSIYLSGCVCYCPIWGLW